MAAKRGGKSQARRGGGMKTMLVLVVGLLIGLGLAAAYLVFGDRGKLDALLPQPNPQAQAPAPARDREPVAQEPAGTAKPTFDFYTVLPEKEVELPGETAPAEARPAPSADPATAAPASAAAAAAMPAAAPAPATGLQLQAGAFGSAADAEALKARIAMAGQSARVEILVVEGRTLHRVRLGPYGSEAERAAAQKALAEAGVSASAAR
jgi:cell division protein FtsN